MGKGIFSFTWLVGAVSRLRAGWWRYHVSTCGSSQKLPLVCGIQADSSSPFVSSVISPKIKRAVRDTEHWTQCVNLYLQSPIGLHGFVLVKREGTTLPAPLLGPKVMRMVLQTNYIKISNPHIRSENTKRGKIANDKTVNSIEKERTEKAREWKTGKV